MHTYVNCIFDVHYVNAYIHVHLVDVCLASLYVFSYMALSITIFQ